MRKTFPQAAIAFFFAAVLALGLVTACDYGPSWDEADEMDILRMNLWEYARAFGMDESAFERIAAQQGRVTISALTPISQSMEQDHGIAAFYPLGGVVMSSSMSEEQRSALWHMYCWLVFTLGAFALYAVCRELGLSRGAALLAPVMLLLSPRFFAQGHFNNKDIALMALALCCLWQALRLMKKPTFARGLLFAASGALAANTKVAGLALWGLCALFVLLRQLAGRRMTARVWAVAGVTLAAFLGFYALLTPALWHDPIAFVRYLVQNATAFQRWDNTVLFRGALFETAQTPLPWYYLPYMIFATTPLWAQLMIAVGTLWALVNAARRLGTDQGLGLLLTALLWLLPLAFALLTRTRVYNGWRHFYFLYGPMLVSAAWGVQRLWTNLRKRGLRRLFAALLALCMALSGVGILTQHPYQYAYYQPLVQLRGTNFCELDYWNVSVKNALLALAESEEGELTVSGVDLWARDGLRKALRVLPQEVRARIRLKTDGSPARFVLVNPTYLTMSQALLPPGRARVALSAYGQCIMYIVEGTNEP